MLKRVCADCHGVLPPPRSYVVENSDLDVYSNYDHSTSIEPSLLFHHVPAPQNWFVPGFEYEQSGQADLLRAPTASIAPSYAYKRKVTARVIVDPAVAEPSYSFLKVRKKAPYGIASSTPFEVLSIVSLPPNTDYTLLPASEDQYVIRERLLMVEFITPAGDPVNAPVDAGTSPSSIPSGANEFTFSTATTGVLTMKLEAKISGFSLMPATEQAKFKFDVDAIGNSTFAWNVANPGGKPTVNSDFLSATATYTGLPQNNSDFGLKKVRVKYNGGNVGEAKFEVFYDAKVKNHPGGDPTHPNWFHYYKQNAGGGSYTYDPTPGARSSSLSAGGDSSIKIGDYVHSPGGEYITTTKINGLLKATGVSSTNKYYAHFIGVLAHERQHANGEVAQGGATDPDSDWLATSFENNTSKTDPTDPVSASSGVSVVAGFTDDEVYAGGPVEENGISGADTSKDWANPGTNHKP